MNKYQLNKNKNKNGTEPIELALKESIIINSLHNVPTIPNHRASIEDVVQTSKNTKKSVTSGNSQKGKLIKCPLKNIRLGFEGNKDEEPKPRSRNKKEKSTLDFIAKLKEIETLTDNNNFLEQTNEEIDIASKQLEAIKKMLASKLEEVDSNKPYESVDNHRHTCSFAEKIDKQFQKMQKQYCNRTKIRYKSLQDFENLTQSQNILVDERKNCTTKADDQHLSKEKIYHPANKKFNIKKRSDDRTENIYKKFSLLREKISQRGRWIQETKNQFSSKEGSNLSNKTEDAENESHKKRTSSSFINKRKLLRSVRFQEQSDDFSSSEDVKSCEETEIMMEHEDSKDVYQKFSLPLINKHNQKNKSVKDTQTYIKDVVRGPTEQITSNKEKCKNEVSSTNRVQVRTINEYISYLDDLNKSEKMKNDNKRSKILFKDEDFSFSEDEIRYTNEGGLDEQIPLQIVSNEKNTSPLGDWFKADMKLKESVSKSDYLSREFSIDFKSKFSEADKDKVMEKRSMQLLETTQHKFRNQQSCQLANLKGRDRKLYATLNIALKDTLFSPVEQ